MKLKHVLSIICACAVIGVAAIVSTGCASTGGLTPKAEANVTAATDALNTVSHVIEQINTGFLTVAPTVETVLTMTHNQGDAAAVNNVALQDAALTPALTALLAGVQTAITSAKTPAAQIAAVSAAVSPETVTAIVSPIAAAAGS